MKWPYELEVTFPSLNELGQKIASIQILKEQRIDLGSSNEIVFNNTYTFTNPTSFILKRVSNKLSFSSVLYCANFVGSLDLNPSSYVQFLDSNGDVIQEVSLKSGENRITLDIANVSTISLTTEFVVPETLPFENGDQISIILDQKITLYGEV